LRNKLALCNELEKFLARGNLPLGKQEDANDIPAAELLEELQIFVARICTGLNGNLNAGGA
jgi:hypothetical protein